MNRPELEQFTKIMLEEYRFPGTDAAAVFVPTDQRPSPHVQEILDKAGPQRWYPMAGGSQVRIPWHFAKGCESLFERLPKGWDHEHCSFCDGHIDIGKLCWCTDADGGIWVFCKSCYEKVADK
jgi:hypothetical protein